MSLGLPSFSMIFSGKAVSAIERSARGIVAMILTDGTEGGKDLNIYKKVDEVDFQNWTEQNYNYLKLVFAGAPSTVITIRRAENAEGYNAELKKLKDLKWNYLTIPGLGSTDTTTISAWIKQYRDDERKTFKAVLAHCKGDHEGIINLTTENISTTITGAKHTAAEYCARIAGVLAGLSLARSSTYYVLDDISEAETPDDPDDRINAGEMVIVFDGRKYKIVVTFFATPVNAFFIDFTFDVAESFILMTGVATFFPTVLIPLLTFVIVALAASFALMTGDITVFPNCFTFPVSPSVFLVADSVLILAV